MTTAYTSLLGLALPVTGELSGTWGDTVNDSITSLLDSAVAGTTTISSDADVTLTTTTGASNTSRQAILLWTAGGTVTRNITAPAQSKIYTVINKTSSTQSIVLRGAGPTTGVTIVQGESAVCAWNGSDFIKISNTSGAGVFTTLSVSGAVTLSGGTANGVAYLNGSKVVTTGSALVFDGSRIALNTATSNIQLTTSVNTNQAYISLADADGRTAVFRGPNSGSPNAAQIGTTTNHDTIFLYGGSEAMRLTSTSLYTASGINVGIGTSSPGAKLSVTSPAATSAAGAWRSGSTDSVYMTFGRSAYEAGIGVTGATVLLTGASAGDMNIYTNLAGAAIRFGTGNAGTIQATLDSSGNLLVGATSAGSNGITIKPTNSNAQAVSLVAAATTGGAGFAMYSSTAADYKFYVDWAGTIHAISTTISAISDLRFKENVRDIDVGLDKIMALKPRLYDWKKGKGANIKNARGFIAQEFEQVFPDLIDEWKTPAPEGEEPYKSVRQDLIPVLVKAIQEQQAIIQSLTARITALEGA